MGRRIKPYNYSYRVAHRFLVENPKVELAMVYLYTIAHLNPKYNFSKEGARNAWNDYKNKNGGLTLKIWDWTEKKKVEPYKWPHPLSRLVRFEWKNNTIIKHQQGIKNEY